MELYYRTKLILKNYILFLSNDLGFSVHFNQSNFCFAKFNLLVIFIEMEIVWF